MSEQPTSNTQTCKTCGKQFLIIDQEKEFYKKKNQKWPDYCPQCRQDRRIKLRNERKLYKRNCDKCGKQIITTYTPDSSYVVYCQDCFWKHIE